MFTHRKLAVNRFVGSFGLEKGRECRLGECWQHSKHNSTAPPQLCRCSNSLHPTPSHLPVYTCDCADPLNSGSTQLTRLGASEGCDVPCSGDTRIICGGQQAASIYTEVDATPAAVPPNDDYAAVGCYK